jgi:FixJ family two-component response regulator
MMSGSDPLTNEEKEIVAGRFLDKPFKKAQLLEAINSVLNIETLEEQSSQEALMSA